MRRRCLTLALAALGCALVGVSASSSASGRADVGHGLFVAVPHGWRVSYHRFTPCSDPVERFSLIRGRQVLMIQERLDPVRAELSRRPAHFTARGKPSQMECCSIPGRSGWSLQFSDHGRAFYAYVFPGGSKPRSLLRLLDSFRAT
jgi:hypothetical protein